MDLTITTSGEGPLVLLSLTGRLGAATSGLVYDAVLATLGVHTVRDLDLDLTGLDHFDPAATSTLVACHRGRARTRRHSAAGQYPACGPAATVHRRPARPARRRCERRQGPDPACLSQRDETYGEAIVGGGDPRLRSGDPTGVDQSGGCVVVACVPAPAPAAAAQLLTA